MKRKRNRKGPVTAEEKAQKKNDVKARSMLLTALLNEYLLTFSQYKDAKTLFEAIQARFGGNDATKKTQKTLLKQMYENFNASCTESLDTIFNRLNKADIDTMSIDDLYKNFKIIEQEVKRTAVSSSSSGSPNMAFLSSPGSTNKVDTISTQVSAASTPISTVSSPDNTANLSDATVYAFLEYRGVANAIAETCWLMNLLCELHIPSSSATLVYYDNYADIFTKCLLSALFEEFRTSVSVRCPSAQASEEY
nr:ribonuclease H-like domain-containing protein [Tanacetum cinerariifolium]